MTTDPVFAVRDARVGTTVVEVGFTDARYDVGDHAEAEVRQEGLRAIATATGAEPRLMRQVHGADVAVLTEAGPPGPPTADALVTADPTLALVTRAADCVPVLLADPAAGVVGAVHAGRPGLAAGVVPAAVEALRTLGARDLVAWVGPHVCGACYEVPATMREEVADVVPEAWAVTSWGTPSLDLGAGVGAQLRAAGCAVVDVPGCTREDPRWHSYRRDGAAAGRIAGVIWRHG